MASSSSSTSSLLNLSLSSVPVTSFTYVAEGGANLVVAYTPHEQDNNNNNITDHSIDEVLRGTVLRLRKKAHGAPTLSQTTLQEEDASVAFTDSVVVPLLPPNATPRLVSIQINDKDWLERLSNHIENARPPARRAVDAVDTDRGYVVLADNLVGTATDTSLQLSVEIKPKWGFLPNPTYLSSDTKPVKTAHCRFCLHRLHKKHPDSTSFDSDEGDALYTNKDEYCPLDLYSQDKSRVKKALHALVKGWKDSSGKGNNLKIFYEGEMIRPADNIRFLGKAEHEQSQDPESFLPDLLADFVTTSPLVRRLSHLQSSLDPLDVEGLAKIIQTKTGLDLFSSKEDDTLLDKLGGEFNLLEYVAFVRRYITAGEAKEADGGNIDSDGLQLDENSDICTLVIAYLLSAAFKDCSMFITVRQNQAIAPEDNNEDHQRQDGRRQLAAYLVDVDVKSIKRLAKYARLDREIVDTFLRFEKKGGVLEQCIR